MKTISLPKSASMAALMTLAGLTSPGFSDTVVLKNGKTIQNARTEIRDGKITIQADGATLSLPLDRVEDIRTESVQPVQAEEAKPVRVVSELDAKIAEILPTADEDAFLRIPWRTSLLQARREANERRKPIFMWVMSGDPLGGT